MKRTKFIAGALVLSMGLLGTGYAYWTDTLSVKATVSTGKLDVAVSGDKENVEYIYDSGSELDGKDVYLNSEEKVAATIDDTTISVTLPNMHPGTKVVIPYTVTNNSTMPIIGSVEDIATTNPDLLNMLEIKLMKAGVEVVPTTEGTNFATKLKATLDAAYAGTIEVGNTPVNYELIITAPGSLEEEFTETETMGFNTNVKWTQHNDHVANPKQP